MRWYRAARMSKEETALVAALVRLADDLTQPQQMQEELKQKEDKPSSSPGQKPPEPLPDQKKDIRRLLDTGGLPGKAQEIFRDLLNKAGPIRDLHKTLFDALGQYPGAMDRFKTYLKAHPQGETADMERKRALMPAGKAAPVTRAPAPGMAQGPRATMPGGQRAPAPGMPQGVAPGVRAKGDRWTRQAQQPEGEKFAPGEDPSKFGTPAVDIVGDQAMAFSDIPGVKGHVNLNVSVAAVKEALESVFGSDYFYPITTIRVTSLPGKFGQAVSNEPHTIYINEGDMVTAVHRAVENEAVKASQIGKETSFTPEIGHRIEAEIARLLWETIPHEKRHLEDFQTEVAKMKKGEEGSFPSIPESHGESAGKAALSRFRWYSR